MPAGRHFKQQGNSGDVRRQAAAGTVGRNTSPAQGTYAAPSVACGRAPYDGNQKKKGKTGLKVAAVIGVLLLAVIVGTGTAAFFLYRSAMNVKDSALGSVELAKGIKDKFTSGDYAGMLDDVNQINGTLGDVKAETDGPLWKAAEFIPVYGSDIHAARTLIDVASSLSSDALLPVAQSIVDAGANGKLLQEGGTINVPLIQAASSSLQTAIPLVQDANERVQTIGSVHISQVAELVDKVKNGFDTAMPLLDTASKVLPVLPQMLGADGATRTYLVIAQNNSELRSLGGLPGSWGTVLVSNGTISMGDFSSIMDSDKELTATLSADELALSPSTLHDPRQVNILPDFPRVGELAKEFWAQAGKGSVDGVIAIDPVFLQRLLGLTGGYTASNGLQVDGSSAAKVLLSDTYWYYGNDAAAQDAFFSSVASNAFKQVMGNLGNASMLDLWKVFKQSADDGRMLVWMANQDEEAIVSDFGFSGALNADPAKPELGVYLNDATTSKISWYTSCKTTIGQGVKNADGTTTYDVTTAIGNTITAEEASRAPKYVYGADSLKRNKTDMLNYVMLFAPAGGSISDLAVSDGGLVDGESPVGLSLYGHQVYNIHIHALGGETVTMTYKVTVSAEATESLGLRTTPLAQEALM